MLLLRQVSYISSVLLLLSPQLSGNVLEKPMIVYANSVKLNSTDISNVNNTKLTTDSSIDRSPKMFLLTTKSKFDPSRKVELYTKWNGNYSSSNISTNHPLNISSIQEALTNKSEMNASTTNKVSSLALKNPVNSRSSVRRKNHSNHYTDHRTEDDQEQDKRKAYLANDDYEQNQINSYVPDYYSPQIHEYEETYNTLPEDHSNSGYAGLLSDPWRLTMSHQVSNPEPNNHFGPPITAYPIYDEPPVPTRECHCPQVSRQAGCVDPTGTFLSLLWDVAVNLWGLAQIAFTSSLPIIIPILIAKIIIIPLKIIKFLKLIKLFLKFFIILPFFIRVVYPAISNLHNVIFQKIQDVAVSAVSPHTPHSNDLDDDIDDIDLESRYDGNETISSKREVYKLNDTSSFWDLRSCPSRVACEFGAYLSSSTLVNFPQKLTSYLSRRADRVETKKEARNDDYDDYEDDDEDDQVRRDAAFKAFVVALGKKWTQEKCAIFYNCAALF